MFSPIRRYTHLLFALLFCVALTSCDLFGGSSDGGDRPEWTGNWQVETVDGESPQIPFYYSITEEEIELTAKAFGRCQTESGAIQSIDDNVVTAEDPESSDETMRVRMEVSGNTLEMTRLDTDETVTLSSVDRDPDEILDC